MQHKKVSDNLGEFQKFIDSDSKTGIYLEDLVRFDIQCIFGQFESAKKNCRTMGKRLNDALVH